MSKKNLYQKKKLPKVEEIKPIRPLEKITVTDWVWIQIDESQSRVTDRGLDRGRRIKFRIPRRELEAAKIKYKNKNLKILE
jgi:hypothetical protein